MQQQGISQILAILILTACGIGGAWGIYYTTQQIEGQETFSSIQIHSPTEVASNDVIIPELIVGEGHGIRATAPDGWTVKETANSANSPYYTAIFEDELDGSRITLSSWEPDMRGSLLESVSGTEEEIIISEREATKVVGTSAQNGSQSTLILVPGDRQVFSIVASANDEILAAFLSQIVIMGYNE